MNTKEGGKKLRETMINKHGSYDNWVQYTKQIGAIGGANGNTGGFASEKVGADGLTGRQRASIAGKIGGSNRKGYRKPE